MGWVMRWRAGERGSLGRGVIEYCGTNMGGGLHGREEGAQGHAKRKSGNQLRGLQLIFARMGVLRGRDM